MLAIKYLTLITPQNTDKIRKDIQEQKEKVKKRKWYEVTKKGESIMQLKREVHTAEAAAKTAEKFVNKKCFEEGDRAELR